MLSRTYFAKGATLFICTNQNDPVNSVVGEDVLRADRDMAYPPEFSQTNSEGKMARYLVVLCEGSRVYVKIMLEV